MASFADAAATFARIGAAANLGAEHAANEMADTFKEGVQRDELSRYAHPPSTRTPSPPGEPPAAISGALRASMLNEPAVDLGDATWESKSGPTVRWARIQELGGVMTGHPLMRWHEPPGVVHFSEQHSLPPRPYMRPAHDRMIADGSLGDAAAEAVEAVIDAAV